MILLFVQIKRVQQVMYMYMYVLWNVINFYNNFIKLINNFEINSHTFSVCFCYVYVNYMSYKNI